MDKLRGRHFGPLTWYTTEITGDDLNEKIKKIDDIRQYSFQQEKCPTTGRLHFQIYLGFEKPKRATQIKKWFDEKIHIEISKSPKEAWEYCQKADTRIAGPWLSDFKDTNQGKRSDLERVVTSLEKHKCDFNKVARDEPTTYIKYHRGIQALATAMEANSAEYGPKEVLIFWGESDAGKTRTAYEYPNATKVQFSNGFFHWSPGIYETLILDEVDDWKITRGLMLQLLDRYELSVPIKGGWRPWSPKRIILTANSDPTTWIWWDSAFERRISKVRFFSAQK